MTDWVDKAKQAVEQAAEEAKKAAQIAAEEAKKVGESVGIDLGAGKTQEPSADTPTETSNAEAPTTPAAAPAAGESTALAKRVEVLEGQVKRMETILIALKKALSAL